jgi:hypothetical protein
MVAAADSFGFPVGILKDGRIVATPAADFDGVKRDQAFGDKYAAGKYHLGEDWNGNGGGDTDIGLPVYATANGVVTYVGDPKETNNIGGWGNLDVVIIEHVLPTAEHGWGVASLYGHLQNVSVHQGQNVDKGQKIGEIGDFTPDPGKQDQSAHLHFELRSDETIGVGIGYSATPKPSGYLDPTKFITEHSASQPVAAGPTDGNDKLTGTSGNDDLQGLGGNDKLTGLAGNDTLQGGKGRDILGGGDDNDVLYDDVENPGGPHTSDSDPDVLTGGTGNDYLVGGPGDKMYGGPDKDSFFNPRGGASIYGEAGDDTIYGGPPYRNSGISAFADGGADNDVFSGRIAEVSGGTGKDIFGCILFFNSYGMGGANCKIRDFRKGEDDISFAQQNAGLSKKITWAGLDTDGDGRLETGEGGRFGALDLAVTVSKAGTSIVGTVGSEKYTLAVVGVTNLTADDFLF